MTMNKQGWLSSVLHIIHPHSDDAHWGATSHELASRGDLNAMNSATALNGECRASALHSNRAVMTC